MQREIEKYALGFEAYKDYVMAFAPEKAETITGVPADLIINAARILPEDGPFGLQISASPVVHHINGVQNVHAIAALVQLQAASVCPVAPVVQVPAAAASKIVS